MKDAELICGGFLDFEIPKEKLYLLKYFKNDLQRAFLRYYMVFGAVWNFTDHTGYYCSKRFCFKLARRYERLIKVYDDAKRTLSEEGMALVHQIEVGKFHLKKLPKTPRKAST